MSLASVSVAASLVAVLSGVAALGSVFAYVCFVQRSKANAAREAFALAKTCTEVIAGLRVRLEGAGQRIRDLERDLDEARSQSSEHAYHVQRFDAARLAGLLDGVRDDLEAVPPNAQRALRRIHELLARQQPVA
jgi:predicted component of type VI protein secretion system